MKKSAKNLVIKNTALFLIVIFIATLLPFAGGTDVFADTTLPYITSLESERQSVTTKTSKIYLENNAQATGLPGSPVIQKVSNLKAAITKYKDEYITSMDSYEDNYINNNELIDNKLGIVENNNLLLSDYRNSTTIQTASSITNLNTKINAASGSITIRIANINTNSNLAFGNANKSVTLIVDNLTFGSSNKSLTVYGNLIVLNTLSLKNTDIIIKKTSAQTDGNFYIDRPENTGSNVNFKVENMLHTANDFEFTENDASVKADSFILGKGFINNSFNASFEIPNAIFVKNDLTVNQPASLKCKDLIINGDFINQAYNSSFNATGTFYANNNVLLNEKTSIYAGNLVVDGAFTNSIYGSSIDVDNTLYIYSDLKIDKLMTIYANELIVDGSVINSDYNSNFNIGGTLYVKNDFIMNEKMIVTAGDMFVGENFYSYSWDQTFNITKDIFIGGGTTTSRTVINSAQGDLIIEGLLTLGSETIISIGGRMAVGGNITCTGYTFTLSAGGKTTSVLVPNAQEPSPAPSPTPIPTPTPTESPVDTQELTIRQAVITPDIAEGDYLLSISYKRLVGVQKEQIIIKYKDGATIKTVDIDPTLSGTPDLEGYVTFNNILFEADSTDVSIYVIGRTEIVKYIGGNSTAGGYVKGKPYFTTISSERISVPSLVSTVYVDHSAQTIMPSNIKKVEVKFLRKAISDYGKYFYKLKRERYEEYEEASRSYNNKTIEQIEAIISSDSGNNLVIKTDNLNLTKNIKLGSSTKSVTLIVDNLTVNTPVNIEIFGNLIVKNNFNANQAMTIKINKANGEGGNFYTGNVNYNGKSTFNVANMMYATSLTLQQGGTITANSLIVFGRLTVNSTSQITAIGDIYSGSVTCNQAANITVTYGDFVVRNELIVNSTFVLTVGGRVCVGKRIIINSSPSIWAGTQKTALIFVGEEREPEISVVVSDILSKIVSINLRGSVYPADINQIANFNVNQVYFAGDAIYYKVDLPVNISNITINCSLNTSGAISVFEPLPNTNYYVAGVLSDGTVGSALQTSLSSNTLNINSISITKGTSTYIFKAKLKRNITAPGKINTVNNTVTLNYKNEDGTSFIITKNFTTTVVATPGLRLN